jgi:hypothetical protein
MATRSPAVAATHPPACESSQFTLSLGLTREVRLAHSERWVGWVSYTNHGASCLMGRLDVGVQAITLGHQPIGQGSVSDLVARQPFTLHHGASARALVELILTFGSKVYSCIPIPVTSIEIEGYLFGWPRHYFSVTRWRELALCTGESLAAVGGVPEPTRT